MRQNLFILTSLSLLISSCGPSVLRPEKSNSNTYALQSVSDYSAGNDCIQTSLHQNLSVTDYGKFKACRSPSLKSVITLEGSFENAKEVCVFPLQNYTTPTGGKKQVFKLDAYGAPYAECGALSTNQVLRINFQQTVFDALIIVPKAERVNMQTCLAANFNCVEYSYGIW